MFSNIRSTKDKFDFEMPIFGFKKDRKNKKVPKKASSMSNIYHDYSGTSAKLQEIEDFEENQENLNKQYRGSYISHFFTHSINHVKMELRK